MRTDLCTLCMAFGATRSFAVWQNGVYEAVSKQAFLHVSAPPRSMPAIPGTLSLSPLGLYCFHAFAKANAPRSPNPRQTFFQHGH